MLPPPHAGTEGTPVADERPECTRFQPYLNFSSIPSIGFFRSSRMGWAVLALGYIAAGKYQRTHLTCPPQNARFQPRRHS
eukprot:COSAG01_NODE_1390_length_10496_cov_8.535116_6_plen_80_part_00